VHFIPLHLQPFCCRAYGYRTGDFPAAEKEFRSCLSLPIYPSMTEKEIDHVIAAVLDAANASRINGNATADINPTA
jgi:dTDP-4-amino-4,6-dideoxygalactose transaminase